MTSARFSRLPAYVRASRDTTSCGVLARRCRMTLDEMNPAPPVTSTRFRFTGPNVIHTPASSSRRARARSTRNRHRHATGRADTLLPHPGWGVGGGSRDGDRAPPYRPLSQLALDGVEGPAFDLALDAAEVLADEREDEALDAEDVGDPDACQQRAREVVLRDPEDDRVHRQEGGDERADRA